jgi:hypothetical protein
MITLEDFRKLKFARKILRKLRDKGKKYNIKTLPHIQPELDSTEQSIQLNVPNYELIRLSPGDPENALKGYSFGYAERLKSEERLITNFTPVKLIRMK